jgi:hypothetical protein
VVEYKVFTARYSIDTVKYAEGKRKGTVKRMGTIEERGWLSKSINDELNKLNQQNKGWKVHSISSVEAVGDIFAIILFEKP